MNISHAFSGFALVKLSWKIQDSTKSSVKFEAFQIRETFFYDAKNLGLQIILTCLEN